MNKARLALIAAVASFAVAAPATASAQTPTPAVAQVQQAQTQLEGVKTQLKAKLAEAVALNDAIKAIDAKVAQVDAEIAKTRQQAATAHPMFAPHFKIVEAILVGQKQALLADRQAKADAAARVMLDVQALQRKASELQDMIQNVISRMSAAEKAVIAGIR